MRVGNAIPSDALTLQRIRDLADFMGKVGRHLQSGGTLSPKSWAFLRDFVPTVEEALREFYIWERERTPPDAAVTPPGAGVRHGTR
jgi:hypothetical protein